jgi:hypothetical protein
VDLMSSDPNKGKGSNSENIQGNALSHSPADCRSAGLSAGLILVGAADAEPAAIPGAARLP